MTIEPAASSLTARGKQYLIKPGMKAIANFVTKKETLLSYILREARLTADF